jgi:hypothetical protein
MSKHGLYYDSDFNYIMFIADGGKLDKDKFEHDPAYRDKIHEDFIKRRAKVYQEWVKQGVNGKPMAPKKASNPILDTISTITEPLASAFESVVSVPKTIVEAGAGLIGDVGHAVRDVGTGVKSGFEFIPYLMVGGVALAGLYVFSQSRGGRQSSRRYSPY